MRKEPLYRLPRLARTFKQSDQGLCCLLTAFQGTIENVLFTHSI